VNSWCVSQRRFFGLQGSSSPFYIASGHPHLLRPLPPGLPPTLPFRIRGLPSVVVSTNPSSPSLRPSWFQRKPRNLLTPSARPPLPLKEASRRKPKLTLPPPPCICKRTPRGMLRFLVRQLSKRRKSLPAVLFSRISESCTCSLKRRKEFVKKRKCLSQLLQQPRPPDAQTRKVRASKCFWST